MRKILLTVITLFIANTSFSFTGQGFRVLNESIKSTPGFNFKIEDLPTTLPAKTSAQVRASAPNRMGQVGQNSQVYGYHSVNIWNTSKKVQKYEYTYALDCEEFHGSYIKIIEVYPGGYFAADTYSMGTVKKQNAGSYKITASTKVKGESNANNSNNGTLTVYK